MTETRRDEFDIGHPAPDRGRLGWFRVAFGLLGAPLAWTLQLSFGASLSGLVCLGPAGTVTPTGADWPASVLWAVNLAALAVAIAAGLVAYANMRATRHEGKGRSGGVMQAGEGRTRFLSVWGLWISMLFAIATLANTVAVFWRGLCPV